MKKEEVYVRLDTTEKVKQFYKLLVETGEPMYEHSCNRWETGRIDGINEGAAFQHNKWYGSNSTRLTEVTIEQLEEILKPKEMKKEFEKGDYIITLKLEDGFRTDCAKENYCFKIRVSEYEGIYPEIDLVGSASNGNCSLKLDKTYKLKDWRYATPEEITEYNKQGKPFDVTTLKNTIIMKNQSVTRQDLQTLYNAACSQWKATITDYANRISPFENSLELTAEEITAIFEASSTSQKEVLNSVGLVEPVPESTNAFTRNLTREDIRGIADAMDNVVFDVVNGYADCIGREDLRYKSLLVSHEVEVILHNSDGRTIIEFKKKQEL